MTYIDEEEKLDSLAQNLPPPVRKALGNTDLVMAISEIADKYDLLIEQQGTLYELTRKVITGEMRAENLVTELKERASKKDNWDDLDEKKIDGILQILNARIFLPIREAMQKSTETKEEEVPTREEVLHGIENPVKSVERASVAKTVTPPVPVAPKPAQTPAPKPVDTKPKPPEATVPKSTSIEVLPNMNIMQAKLSNAVKMPVTEVKIPQTPPVSTPKPIPPAPQKYTTDPYREPPTA
ncbi:MAG: hypothetical protein PHV42_02035 [Candidatus Pacebacteria bacterium]|nr:hypothetical protein [Candidatus Paceibacterota bacterium]